MFQIVCIILIKKTNQPSEAEGPKMLFPDR